MAIEGAVLDKTGDSGEELKYNKRNRVGRGLRWEDIADANQALRVSKTSKDNVYSRPDYEALVAGGMERVAAHLLKQVYDAIAVTPVVRSTPTDEDLQRYIVGVNRVMEATMSWANDKNALQAWAQKQARVAGAMLGRATALTDLMLSKSLLDRVYPDQTWRRNPELSLLGSKKVLETLQPGYDEAQRAFKAIDKGWPGKMEAWQRQGYEVVEAATVLRIGDGWKYLKEGGREQVFGVQLRHGWVESYTTREAAVEALAQFKPWLLLDKHNRIKAQGETREELIEKARELTKRAGKTGPDERGIALADVGRRGPGHRAPGEDISSDRLRETFGFKGINFGNWMQGDSNRAERQAHLNYAFDAFHDLAAVLGIPPRAVSLNGMFGLAFGAQGNGAYAAHFVPGLNEINLTRTRGAGSVAHEWAHGLDHFLARMAGLEGEKQPFLSEYTRQSPTYMRFERNGGTATPVEVKRFGEIRPELVARMADVVKAMNDRTVTRSEAEGIEHWETQKARADKSLDSWLKSVRRDFGGHEARFDTFAERIRSLDVGGEQIAVSSSTYLFPVVKEMREAFKACTGRTYSLEQCKHLSNSLSYLHHLVTDRDSVIARFMEPKTDRTQYAANAMALDGNKGGKTYWSTDLEMFARAFDAFVSDSLAHRDGFNSYLSHAGRDDETVPMGTEREAITAAIGALTRELRVAELHQDVETVQSTAKEAEAVTVDVPLVVAVAETRAAMATTERVAINQDSGTYRGSVLSITDTHVIQNVGRGFVAEHEKTKFGACPQVGDRVEVRYRDGVPAVRIDGQGAVHAKDQLTLF